MRSMHDAHLRTRAVRFRVEENASIDEIATWLALPRTTVFHWLRDHPIDRGARPPSAARLRASAENARRAKVKRDAAYAEGLDQWPELSEQPGFRDFVVLYIAEGYKRNRNVVQICNSDAAVMRVAQCWLPRLTSRRLSYAVQVHADQDLDAVRNHWGTALGIQEESIKLQRKSNSGQLGGRRWRSEHGVLSIAVGDTYLRSRLSAWIDQVRGGWLASSLDGV